MTLIRAHSAINVNVGLLGVHIIRIIEIKKLFVTRTTLSFSRAFLYLVNFIIYCTPVAYLDSNRNSYKPKPRYWIYLKFWTFIWTKFTKKKLQLYKLSWNLKKYWKKSHFISQTLIFHCLNKIFLKKVDFFFYFRSHERLELPAHAIGISNWPGWIKNCTGDGEYFMENAIVFTKKFGSVK